MTLIPIMTSFPEFQPKSQLLSNPRLQQDWLWLAVNLLTLGPCGRVVIL